MNFLKLKDAANKLLEFMEKYDLDDYNENKGIFLEKTKNYCNYIKGDYYFLEKSKNLVISKEGVKVELIFLKK